jgi:hypothetical protein
VMISFDVYNLAGELVWQAHGQGQAGQVLWNLGSASGHAVSNGIYLVKCRAVTGDGAADDIQFMKLAVTR